MRGRSAWRQPLWHAFRRARSRDAIGYVPQGHAGVLRLHGARVRADGPHRAPRRVLRSRRRATSRWRSGRSSRSASRTSRPSRSPRSPAASASSRWWRARSRRSRSCWCSTSRPRASISATRCACCERIAALAGSGIAILFSSHDPDHAFLCAAPRAAARRGPRARDRRAARGDPPRHARAPVRRLGAGAAARRRRPHLLARDRPLI